MEIRKTKAEELDRLEEIYASARAFMAENGNGGQWGKNHPPRELLEEDIREGRSYVCVEDGKIVGTFCFYVGEEPTYREIDGAWKQEGDYGVIHRVASDGTTKGVTKACVDWCWEQHPNLRIDTHEKNLPMQRAILKNGFTYCGKITVEDGSQRLAYQRV